MERQIDIKTLLNASVIMFKLCFTSDVWAQ